jgi:tRNA(adenine34) deaminase
MHEFFMRKALAEAQAAFDEEEVPIGAIVVHGERIIAAAHNQREQLKSHLNDWRLEGCTLYVTLEPCAMCAGAIVLARVPTVVYGAADPKAGAVATLYQLLSDPRLNHSCQTVGGILGRECGEILSRFFQMQRAKGKK